MIKALGVLHRGIKLYEGKNIKELDACGLSLAPLRQELDACCLFLQELGA